MVETPQSDASHDSDGETNGAALGKNLAAKDKECPYCHQRFTSSSLGRHLDQYIFKKRPDGIHNVEEIRQQRGGITRRTPRQGSASKRDRAGSQPTRTSSLEARGTPPANIDLLNGKPVGGIRMEFNTMNWHSTGVINNLDTQKLTSHTPLAPTPTGTKRNWGAYETGQWESLDSKADTGSDKDAVRALELALREVLDSLQAATARAASTERSSPFDFDIQAHTFPSLCLLLLPSPPTLFSTAPFPTPTSFPLDPPGPMHLDALHHHLQNVIHRWKWDALAAAQRASYPNPFSTAANLGEEHESLSRSAQQYEEMATKHLELSYAQWTSAGGDEQRAKQWQLELARAFVGEQEKRREAEERVERVQQEASQLQSQVEMLSRCQWPREMALWPPERVPVGNGVVRELRWELRRHNNNNISSEGVAGGALGDASRWDFEKLVGKWKRVVREDKGRRTGPMGVQHRPPDEHETTAPPTPQQQQQRMPSQVAGLDASKVHGIRRGGAVNGEEPKRRSARMHGVTSTADRDEADGDFNDASMMNGEGKGMRE